MDMEKKSPLRDVMNSTMEKVREMVDANNIVGAPITTPDAGELCGEKWPAAHCCDLAGRQ